MRMPLKDGQRGVTVLTWALLLMLVAVIAVIVLIFVVDSQPTPMPVQM